MLNSEQIEVYLKRLNLEKEAPSLEYLNKLQENHLLNIPFENLDVMNKKHITLSFHNLFDKIINNNRGGFCFELNGSYYNLLKSVGFTVSMAEAAVYNAKLENFGCMRNHMTLIVMIENQRYLTDVGFGDSFRRPISIEKRETEDVSGKYRLRHYDAYHYRLNDKEKTKEEYDYLILEHFTNEEWKPQYKFHYSQKLVLEDYQINCNWVQSSPDSHFTKGRTWTIARKTGRVSLSENGVTITENLMKNKIEYTKLKGFDQYLKKYQI